MIFSPTCFDRTSDYRYYSHEKRGGDVNDREEHIDFDRPFQIGLSVTKPRYAQNRHADAQLK